MGEKRRFRTPCTNLGRNGDSGNRRLHREQLEDRVQLGLLQAGEQLCRRSVAINNPRAYRSRGDCEFGRLQWGATVCAIGGTVSIELENLLSSV